MRALRQAVDDAAAACDAAAERQRNAEMSAARDRALVTELRGQLQAERDRNVSTVNALRKTIDSLRRKRAQDVAAQERSGRRRGGGDGVGGDAVGAGGVGEEDGLLREGADGGANSLAVRALLEAEATTLDALRVLDRKVQHRNRRSGGAESPPSGRTHDATSSPRSNTPSRTATADNNADNNNLLGGGSPRGGSPRLAAAERERDALAQRLADAEDRAAAAEARREDEQRGMLQFLREQRSIDPAERYLDEASRTIAELTAALESERGRADVLETEMGAQGQQIELLLRSARENKGKKGFHASRLSGYWDGRGEGGWELDVNALRKQAGMRDVPPPPEPEEEEEEEDGGAPPAENGGRGSALLRGQETF
jgi:hypothetical protein